LGGKKMAMEIGKECSWQDMQLYRFEKTGWPISPRLSYYPDTNAAFSTNRLTKIGDNMAILYVNISNAMEDETPFYF
jgi:hypothetical protein